MQEYELEHVSNDYDKQNNNISFYVSSAKRFPILDREEEHEIALRALAGDKAAGKKLVESNLLLVVKIAHEYRKVFNNLNDLIQEGNIGLLRSLNKYNPDRGCRFSTYAGWWIRSMMLRFMFHNSHMIKPGTTNEQKKLFYNLRKEQKRLEDMGVDADAATIAQNLDVSEEDVVEMDSRLRHDVYLDSPAPVNDDDKKTLADTISSSVDEQPDVVVEGNNFREMLCKKLDLFASKLKNDRQRAIFYKRIIADEPLTLQELGDSFNITKERTRQIEEEITGRLKKYLKNCISR